MPENGRFIGNLPGFLQLQVRKKIVEGWTGRARASPLCRILMGTKRQSGNALALPFWMVTEFG